LITLEVVKLLEAYIRAALYPNTNVYLGIKLRNTTNFVMRVNLQLSVLIVLH